MRPLAECRVAAAEETVRTVFSRSLPTRRTGAVMIVDGAGMLAGIFTDSDLARLFERRNDAALDAPIGRVMTARPTTVPAGTRLRDAVALLETRRLSELPVLGRDGRPCGLRSPHPAAAPPPPDNQPPCPPPTSPAASPACSSCCSTWTACSPMAA
jgi:arabinose-5-phosphate isomerase